MKKGLTNHTGFIYNRKKRVIRESVEPGDFLDCTSGLVNARKNKEDYIMAKRGGYPGMGMPGNMNNLMKQAQRMQRQMEESQKELEAKEYTAAAGGGAVEVTVTGKKEVTKVKLAAEVVDPDDIEMLEDLIMAATNQALRQAEEESAAAMSKLTGGLGGLPF